MGEKDPPPNTLTHSSQVIEKLGLPATTEPAEANPPAASPSDLSHVGPPPAQPESNSQTPESSIHDLHIPDSDIPESSTHESSIPDSGIPDSGIHEFARLPETQNQQNPNAVPPLRPSNPGQTVWITYLTGQPVPANCVRPISRAQDVLSRNEAAVYDNFIAKHQDQITGTLSGFDRLVFPGTFGLIGHAEGMRRYLWANQVLLQDFGSNFEKVSLRLKEPSLAEAEAAWPPVKHLASGQVRKKEMAQGMAAKEGMGDGLSCVEPCWSFESHRRRDNEEVGTGAAPPQAPVAVPLLDAPGIRLHEHPHSNLVSLSRADLSERPPMASAAEGRSRRGLCAPRQLLPVDRLTTGKTRPLLSHLVGAPGTLGPKRSEPTRRSIRPPCRPRCGLSPAV